MGLQAPEEAQENSGQIPDKMTMILVLEVLRSV